MLRFRLLELLESLRLFRREAGVYFFFSSLLTKALSFLTSWLALRMLEDVELGKAIFAYQVIAFALPFMGLGIGSSLLRYGGMKDCREEQDAMFVEVLRKGLLLNVLLIGLLWFFSAPLLSRVAGSDRYLHIFSLMLVTHYLLELIKLYALTTRRNVYFAYAESTHAVLLLIAVVLGARYDGVRGYAWAFVLAPAVTVAVWMPSLGIPWRAFWKRVASSLNAELWRYGLFTSFSNVAGQLLFVIDLLLIGLLLKDPLQVTVYKYVSLIPFSALFLSQIYMRAHFVELSRRMKEAVFLRDFIRRYRLLFGLLFAVFFAFCFFLKDLLLQFFDPSFAVYSDVFLVLCFGVGGVFLFRGLYGNLLSAAGESRFNFYIAAFFLLVNLVANWFLIPAYGLLGAAMTSAAVMWLSGVVSGLVFGHVERGIRRVE